ncbi:restriction endonuclease subunit S [Empedobacter falsenii]
MERINNLEDICEVITKGTTPTSVGFNFELDGTVNFVKIESFDKEGNILADKVAKISEECNEALKRSQLKEGDILFSIAGALGRVGIVNNNILPGNTNQALAIVRLKDKSDINIRYIKHILSSEYVQNQVNNNKGGVAQQNLSLAQIKKFQIPEYSLEKKLAIVEKLDQAFELIDQAKANIEQNIINAKELFQSKLDEVFSQKGDGWEESKLKEVGKIVSGATPKSKVAEFWDGEISWITPKDLGTLGGQKYILGTSRKITELGLSSCSAQLMPKGSVIMSSRAPIGHLGIATDDICTNQGCKSIVPNENMNSEYIYYYLLSSKEALNKLGTGAVFPELSGKMFGDFTIPVPLLEDQEKAVKIFDEASELTNSLISIYHQKLNNLEELRKSILEKAFRGELTN